MKNFSLIVAAVMVLFLQGFTKAPVNRVLLPGTYTGSPSLMLKLEADHTFIYINTCDAQHPIDITGTWVQKNNTIILGGYTSKTSVNDTWTIAQNNNCLKSRRGMEFIRICRD